MTIVEFLTARLDEDETLAGIATPGPWHVGESPHRTNVVLSEDMLDRVGTAGGRMDLPAPVFTGQTASRPRSWWEADAVHIARHDPARVLADVVAKRAIIAEHAQVQVGDSPPLYGCTVCDAGCQCYPGVNGYGTQGCKTVRIMAAVYADHPDYDESWRP